MKVYMVVRFSPRIVKRRYVGNKFDGVYESGQDSVRIEGVYMSKKLAENHRLKFGFFGSIITKSIRGVSVYALKDNKTFLIKKLAD